MKVAFSEAASALLITQSAMSRRIQKLKERLQVEMFQRHRRGPALT
tara:strand:- start:280 stop:417 length:138 start_codon:yes stop_codon:yes gene_type:complete